jgi:hypothetical protein
VNVSEALEDIGENIKFSPTDGKYGLMKYAQMYWIKESKLNFWN